MSPTVQPRCAQASRKDLSEARNYMTTGADAIP
jgi:hypothetical protein